MEDSLTPVLSPTLPALCSTSTESKNKLLSLWQNKATNPWSLESNFQKHYHFQLPILLHPMPPMSPITGIYTIHHHQSYLDQATSLPWHQDGYGWSHLFPLSRKTKQDPVMRLVPIQNQQDPGPQINERGMELNHCQNVSQILDLFVSKVSEKLPPHGLDDHKINFVPGGALEAPFGPLCRLSTDKPLALNGYIEVILAKEFIRASSSSGGAPVFFIKKVDGSLCLCVDSCGLSPITMKKRYPLPLI